MGYVVCQRAYQYNDEIDQVQEGGNPKRYFKKKEDAEKECEKRNITDLRGRSLAGYFYSPYDFFRNPEMAAILLKEDLKKWDWDGWGVPKDMSDEDCKVLLNCIDEDHRFYYVVEVEG